ncbi:MAG TPA: DUF1579 domain-containing protein [Gemmatimonadota bacterium]|jgi:hypothetical protein|nr:DUF1579 domain-containing protein [Gemmatimonadota bacterium]
MIRRNWIHAWLGMAVALFVAAPSVAQEAEAAAGHEQDQEMMAKWAEYATPGEAHERLAKHVGDWDYTMKWWMTPDAEAEESTGTMSASMTMDGRFLVENWEGMAMGQPFKGQGITGYDNFNKEYVSTWIDNMGTGIMASTGTYDPAQDALVTTGTFDDIMTGEKDKTMRGTSKFLDDNTLHIEMFVPGPDGQEFKTGEIHAVRKQ